MGSACQRNLVEKVFWSNSLGIAKTTQLCQGSKSLKTILIGLEKKKSEEPTLTDRLFGIRFIFPSVFVAFFPQKNKFIKLGFAELKKILKITYINTKYLYFR